MARLALAGAGRDSDPKLLTFASDGPIEKGGAFLVQGRHQQLTGKSECIRAFHALLDDARRKTVSEGDHRTLAAIAVEAELVSKTADSSFIHVLKKDGSVIERRVPQKTNDFEEFLRVFFKATGGKDDPRWTGLYQELLSLRMNILARRGAAKRSALTGLSTAAVSSTAATGSDPPPLSADPSDGLPAVEPAPFDIRALEAHALRPLIGREDETRLLADTFEAALADAPGRARVLTFFAFGGEGETGLISHWAGDLRKRAGIRPLPPVFAYSFYRQGADSLLATSSDLFLDAALEFFGAAGAPGENPNDKAERLASLVEQRGAVLLADGLEPLQFDPSSATPGKLKDQPLAALLTALAKRRRGLCVVTTRYRIADLDDFGDSVAPQHALLPLSPENGVALLRSLRWRQGTKSIGLVGNEAEFKALSAWTRGHALTLNLMGSYLLLAHQGDIRQRDRVLLDEADDEVAPGPSSSRHAARVMDAYVNWFYGSGAKGRRALVLLRSIGLFDRPASAGCLKALLARPPIADLTEPLLDPSDAQLDVIANRLQAAGLLTCVRGESPDRPLIEVDAHPLLREYFAKRLSDDHPQAWIDANARLYEHLCATEEPADPSQVAQLEPLYQAIVHGCRAGRQQAAFDDVFEARICRGKEQRSTGRLGAFNHDLSALSAFFVRPWDRPAPVLAPHTRMQIAGMAAFRLRSAGRFAEAAPLMRESLAYHESVSDWTAASDEAGNLSVLLMNAGDLSGSLAAARQALVHALSSGDRRLLRDRYATLGDPLIQLGPPMWGEARQAFEAAEALQRELEPKRPLLYSTKGYRYHELLLELGEIDELLTRTERTAEWIAPRYQRLDPGLNRMMRGRALLRRAQSTGRGADWQAARQSLDQALNDLRAAGFQENLARVLVAHAQAGLQGSAGKQGSGPRDAEQRRDSARTELDEAWKIAELGPMPLFQVDILLMRLRLFGLPAPADVSAAYPWVSPTDDLARARHLIERHGYLRRQADAEDCARRLARA